jgi:mannosyltransferase
MPQGRVLAHCAAAGPVERCRGNGLSSAESLRRARCALRPVEHTARTAVNKQEASAPVAEVAGPARGAGWAAAGARYAPVAAAAATMACLGAWGLARYSAMGNDEVASRWAASLSLGQLAHLLRHIDAVHGLYYLLLHGWMAVGTSPAVLRVPSVIGMSAAAALIVILARRLTGSGWAGLFAGLIMATTTSVSFYAQTARSYALVSACVLGQTLALVSVLHAEKADAEGSRISRGWLVYGALVTLGGYLNEMALLVLAAHAVTIVLTRAGRRAARHWAVTSALSIALLTPLLILSGPQHAAVSWIVRPDLYQVRLLYHDYFGATVTSALLVGACAVVAVLPPGRWWRRSMGGVGLLSVAVPLLLVPAGILLLESVAAQPLYQDRYVQYGEAGAALLAGAGAYRAGRWLAAAIRRRELIVVPGVVVCLCALVLQLNAQRGARTPQSRAFNFGGPSIYVGTHAHRGDGVLFMDSFYRKAELGYPDEFRKTSDLALAEAPAAAASYLGANKPFAAIRPLMLSHRRIWVIGYLPSAGLPAGTLREESLVLGRDFRRLVVRGFKGIWLTLWIRRG